MILGLYSLALRCLQPLMLRKLRRRAQAEPGYGIAPQERLGRYTCAATLPGERVVWVHAVSLGETIACAALLTELRVLMPGMRLLLTHGTATGRAQGAGLLLPGDVQVWQPWDTPAAVNKFLAHFNPVVGLLVETEIWPNLVAQCLAQGVPLCLVNARLSEKSLQQARRLAWLARPAYSGLRAVWAQAPADAQRLAALGAPVQGILGNFKFDARPDADKLALGKNWRAALAKPVISFAISREGEEELFLAFLESKVPVVQVKPASVATELIASNVQWMIVPRHPQRFEAVAELCQARGWNVSRRSLWGNAGPASVDGDANTNAHTAPTIWMGDTLGEMALYYGLSDVALLGGSFAPLGGQNLIEAAACGCPVVMGPHTFNFAQAAELSVEAGAAWQVADMEAAVDKALELVHNPTKQHAASHAASALAGAHQGAARRTALAVQALLESA
jgi:3-deoxy-D-manno-octulosonic-acid transferase